MDYEKLKEVIAKQIKENGRGEITGPILQAVLMAMVDSLGEVYPQNYTEEEKARARANIDALSNYDGEITKEKLSAEVQAILNDVANKQNITDESLATIAKTIVGAINEVYKGGLEDASIATSKIEDGAVTEPKLDNVLVAKVNNNVKVVEQTLTNDEIDIASKNLKFRDGNGNFFADKASYDSVAKLSVKPVHSVFGTNCVKNTFGEFCNYIKFGNCCDHNEIKNQCDANLFGNKCVSNSIGNYCQGNTFGNFCENNKLSEHCNGNTFGDYCYGNDFGENLLLSKIDNGVSFIELKSNANWSKKKFLVNIHILSGVKGESSTKMLAISIPDEYLNSSRELMITTKRTDESPSTPEDIVMYYADEVVDKQNKQDDTLETTSKEVVGAINELFNGGVKDKSIDASKLAQAVQDTLGKVGMNVKEINTDTDLNDLKEDGLYLLSAGHSYTNYPLSDGETTSKNFVYLRFPAILISSQKTEAYVEQIVFSVSEIMSLPLIRKREYFKSITTWLDWTNDMMYNMWQGVNDSVKKQDLSALSDTEVNNIWDNN